MPKNDVVVELFYNGVWNDITADDEVFTETPITIIQGLSDEMGGLRPCNISMKLNNALDKFRISNPLSPLYRLVGRNTPIRVSVDGLVRGIAEVNLWDCDQTRDFRATPRRGKAWADIKAGGVLDRVNKWTRFVRSPLYRAFTFAPSDGYVLNEYWDMEVPSGGTEAPSSVTGSYPMRPVTQVRYTLPGGSPLPPGGAPDFASGNGITGSASLPSFQNGGTLRATVKTKTYDGYAVDWVMQHAAGTDAGGTTSADVLRWYETGTYVEYRVNVVKNIVTIFYANAADSATGASTGSVVANFDVYDGAAHHFRFQVRQNGGNYAMEFYIDSALYDTDNPAGTVVQPRLIEWNPLEDRGDYMPISAGHTAIWGSGQIGGQASVFFATNGYAGETVADRFARILTEEGIAYQILGTAANSEKMGPQRPDTLFNIIKEIQLTEDALVYDDGDELEINIKLLEARFSQNLLTLYPTDLGKLPKESTDNGDIRNVVTVKDRVTGVEFTSEDSTSFVGTQTPPDGIGEAKEDITVNLYEPILEIQSHSNWWLRRNTVDLPKYPTLEVDLNASPHLKDDIQNIFPGSFIEIVGMRENTIRLFVLGWTEVIGTHSRKITYTCKPSQQFDVQDWDDTDSRWDLKSSVLDGEHDINDTTLALLNIDDEAWSTTPGYDFFISGERVTVTAMTARSGAGPLSTQTATVLRGVNGIRKKLPNFAEVHVATPGRWSK